MNYSVLAVGQVWTDEDGDRAEIISLDDEPYPVQFRWLEGGYGGVGPGRDTVEGFLAFHSMPTSWWLELLATNRDETTEIEAALRPHSGDYWEVSHDGNTWKRWPATELLPLHAYGYSRVRRERTHTPMCDDLHEKSPNPEPCICPEDWEDRS